MPITERAGKQPQQTSELRTRNSSKDKGLRIVPGVADLCCGMGGLSLAASQLGMSVVVGVDCNRTALRTFESNFPSAKPLAGSVRSRKLLKCCHRFLAPTEGHSAPCVVISGPPCQGFSAAGSRNPADPRNQIFLAVAHAVVVLQPHCGPA